MFSDLRSCDKVQAAKHSQVQPNSIEAPTDIVCMARSCM